VIDPETPVGFKRQPEMMRISEALLAFGRFPIILLPCLWVFARRRLKWGHLRRKAKGLSAFPIEIGGDVRRHESPFEHPPVEAVAHGSRFAGCDFDILGPVVRVTNHAADLEFTGRQ